MFIDLVDRVEFDLRVADLFSSRSQSRRTFWNNDQMNYVKKILSDLNTIEKKSSQHYYYGKKYKLVIEGDAAHVCLNNENDVNSMIYVIPYEHYYDKLMESHLRTGHGARDKMHHYCKERWVISKEVCQLFADMCRTCAKKRGRYVKCIAGMPVAKTCWDSANWI